MRLMRKKGEGGRKTSHERWAKRGGERGVGLVLGSAMAHRCGQRLSYVLAVVAAWVSVAVPVQVRSTW